MAYTIFAADKLAPEGLAYIHDQPDAMLLDKAGIDAAGAAAVLAAGGVHAMIVRSGIRVTAEVLANPGDLKIIARAGVGVDNIDLEAATAKGILVVNTAEASTITTAEHAFGLMMALLRNLGPAYVSMREGRWERGLKGRQLSGMTLGVVGLGRIGRTVASRALAFGMNVVGYDPFVNSDIEIDGHTVRVVGSFDELCPLVDVITFHVPRTEQTAGMLNAETFARCRKGVYVVNAARGGIIDEAALLDALESGRCGGAALDVFDKEPPPADHPLRLHPRALTTPHLGASTLEAQQAVSIDAARACLAYLRGEGISGAVNAGGVRVDLSPRQRGYVDLAERMATLIAPMITRGIAKVDVELSGADLAPAAGTVERTVLVALLRRHLDEPLNVINVAAVAKQRKIDFTVTTREESPFAGGQLSVVVSGPPGAVDDGTHAADQVRRVVGRLYEDLRPRVVEINGYRMDMVPEGPMALVQNADQPGMIGLVGSEFGSASVNIADMTIARRPDPDGKTFTALMLLKLDSAPPVDLLNRLSARPGVLKVASVTLPALRGG
jgi:D-3-phosphoglycerate dehydrogenase / 2-oxoglutarate reductase